jgi:hypothetical protein
MGAPLTQAQEYVHRLIKEGHLSPVEISELLNGRVSSRTIYRWLRGQSVPQNSSDFDALENLVSSRLEKKEVNA